MVKRVIKAIALLPVVYLFIVAIGLVPVNNNFESTPDGIEMYVVSNAIHADIILPRSNPIVDWIQAFANTKFKGDISRMTHVAVGWGDCRFYIETPTWDQFKVSNAANALFLPSDSCIHVTFTRPEYYQDAIPIKVSHKQYHDLVSFINEAFKKDDHGQIIQIQEGAYSTTDAFFEAHGTYHFLNTCNAWTGRALGHAGLTVPWFSPLPKTPLLYLKTSA